MFANEIYFDYLALSFLWSMTMSTILERDARPISDLQTKTAELLAHIQQTGRPILLKDNSKLTAVLISPESFTAKLETEHLSRLLEEGEAEIAAGKAIPIHEFLMTLPDANFED
jgi:PHD/YefM family antitoxin component YafN of YafNO toxin-antitoxin module